MATERQRPVPASYSCTYTIGASGHGSMSNPLVKSDTVYGLVSNGIFIGGSIASGFNDLLIAARVPSGTTPLSGRYQIVGMDVPSGDQKDTCDFWSSLSPTAVQGPLSISGYQAGQNAPVNLSVPATYSFFGGVATIRVELNSSNLLSGTQTL